ncbi:mediator of DNA damage checkpoint protein 1 isoform X2 [Limanda limanda]|uniref:mediator of DNA damage checkpoint protein 1 isoform X2 n=1 Tax=Limanda limanda TaxID=27771 RepID=UPI0029C6C744|nr:mediator of DNA damage checkpoint protein 1 isoform X2 [Limanda limanda]
MEATQVISDSFLESDEAEDEEEDENKRGPPLAKLCILKNELVPETELPLFLGNNVLGRDLSACTLHLPSPSISKQHATISLSVYRRRGRRSEGDVEALVWDLGSMNGTRKGRLKLTPNVRYALSDGDSLVVADIPCQYVSCHVDANNSQGGMRTPVSRNMGVNAGSPDVTEKEGGGKSTDSKKCENRDTKARVSSTKTPVGVSSLFLEQTPTQPEGTLVPESDADSDGERERGGRGRMALVSDSDSHKFSPACSTFLSPTNKIVPESEDESPITPSSSSKNRPYRHVRFSEEETEVDGAGQRLEEKKTLAIVDDSEEEGGGEKETVTPEETKPKESGQHVPVTQERNVSFMGDDELPVSTLAVTKDVILVLNMDSDTDVEEEEEGVSSAGPVTLNINQVSQPPNTAHFHMDSDTDEDEDALDKDLTAVTSSDDSTKLSHVNSDIQPEGITMDSDTDVDDDAVVSDAATKTKPMSVQSASTADSAPSVQPKDFHLDSDTDVEDEDERECGTNESSSKIDEISISIKKPAGPESAAAAPHGLHFESDTDDEEIPAPALSEPPVVFAVASDSCTATDRGVAILSDSDTDMEDDAPQVMSVAVTTLAASPGTKPPAQESDSDADTDVEGSGQSGSKPTDLGLDSDTDVEDKEADIDEAGDDQIPNLCRENTPGLMVPLLQNCSTPVQLQAFDFGMVPEREVEKMETQAFESPSSVPFQGAVAAAVRPVALSSCSDSQEDEDYFVAETQSFILQTRDLHSSPPEDHAIEPTQAFCPETSSDETDQPSSIERSLQLELSSSIHRQCPAQALAMENTQAFVERGVNMEETQAYATTSTADRTSADNDANLEATQDYEEDEEPARYPEKEGQTVLVLEETQAYITKPDSDSESETDEDERKNITATAETQPFGFSTSCTPTMAETQPISAFEEKKSVAEESEERGGTLQPQQRMSGEVLSIAQTQPMNTHSNGESDDEEEEKTQPLTGSDLAVAETQPVHIGCAETQPMATSDDEDLMPGPRKRRAKQLSESELTQTRTNSEVSAVETQPEDPVEGGESDEEDSIPVFKRRRAKPLPLEKTQSLSGSEAFAAETQPMGAREVEQSDEDDSIPGPRKKRKAKQLSESELTQTLTNSEVSAVETQPVDPVDPVEGGESDEEDSIPVFKKRRAKPLQLEETQSLSGSEAFAAETQPMGAREGEQSDKDDSIPGPRKRKAKQLRLEEVETQPLIVEDSIPGPQKRKAKALQLKEEETQPLPSSEVSAVESQVTQSEAGTSGISVRGKRGTRATIGEDEEQTECSESPKRQTRGKSKALPTIRGRRGKSGPVGDVSEEEGELEQGRRTRGRTFTRQQKGKEEEGGKSEFERNKPAENGNRIKKKQKALGEEGGVADLNKERENREIEEIERRRMEEQEKKENKGEQERLHAENMERIRLEQETAEKERKEQEEKQRVEKEIKKRETADRIQKEKEQLEKKKRDKDEKERLEREKSECKEREKLEWERKEQEEKERLEREKRELEERLERESREEEQQARLQREERERLEKEKETKENKSKVSIGGRKATKKTTIATCSIEQDSAVLAKDDFPARRTRSRSNSSNSISSERSASSVSTQQESRGRGRGRGAKRISEPTQTAVVRRGNRRRTVAAETTEQDNNDGVLSRSNSSNSLNSDISSYSVSSQSRGRGGSQRGRPRITEAESDSIPPIKSQSDQNSATKPAARGRKGRKTEPSSSAVPQEDDAEKADSQQARTTRGQRRATTNISESTAADEEKQSNQDEGHGSEESRPPKRNVWGRAQKSGASAASKGDEAKDKVQVRKRELEPNIEEDSHSGTNISIVTVQAVGTTQEGGQDESKDDNPVQPKRRGRASNSQVKKDTNQSPVEVELKVEKENVEKRGRSRPSAVQKKREEEQEESGTSASSTTQEAKVQTPETPTSRVSRKRQAPAASSPVAKTPRSSSSSSPAARGRLQAASPAYKVLFTGVTDEAGERVLARLGGSMAKGVADMDCLVTDQVRRTIKFLCAVAKGIPIVSTCWLEKSGKAGSFLSPNAFVVKDPEQEKKFGFCLQTSLTMASSHLLLQGYEIHVTKSVKPDPAQMKDIISCSGAKFLPKMPSSHKPRTVVISCEEDWSLCGPAVSASLPVVTAEFILSGILQQKVDLQTHALPAPVTNAGGRRRGRNKT